MCFGCALAKLMPKAARFDLDGAVFDLSDIGPSLGQAGKLAELSEFSRAAVETILSADALVIASPVCKGSYACLFKHLFDLLDPASLTGKPILLAATGGGDRHALIIEHQLCPLFGPLRGANSGGRRLRLGY